MDYYYALLDLDDSLIDDFIEERINLLEEENKNSKSFIGYHLGEDQISIDLSLEKKHSLDLRCFHKGYLKKGTKVVFGLSVSDNNEISNLGNYYYLNSYDYIYEFCHFIRDYEIEDERDLFTLIYYFLRSYFGTTKKCPRDQMFNIIYDNKGHAFPLKNEHDLSWFKGKGNAMCSEYAVMAQNILSFLGYETYTIIGHDKVGDKEAENHAYNIVSYEEEYEDGTIKRTNMLIDFYNPIVIHDFNSNIIGEAPFIDCINNFDDDFVHRFINGDEILTFQEYSYMKIGDTLLRIGYDRDRNYYIGNEIITHESKPLTKKRS